MKLPLASELRCNVLTQLMISCNVTQYVPVLEYSKPKPKLFGSSFAEALPGVLCLNVVAKLIDGTTAPVGFEVSGLPSFPFGASGL